MFLEENGLIQDLVNAVAVHFYEEGVEGSDEKLVVFCENYLGLPLEMARRMTVRALQYRESVETTRLNFDEFAKKHLTDLEDFEDSINQENPLVEYVVHVKLRCESQGNNGILLPVDSAISMDCPVEQYECWMDEKGKVTAAGNKAISLALTMGMVANIEKGDQEGFWKRGEHVKQVVDSIGGLSFSPTAVTVKSSFEKE